MSNYFHFFIGPVHDFVASARRTRDFQAGSLLLSWLTAVGAYTAEQLTGQREGVFPQLDDSLRQALAQGGSAVASMPNRFSLPVPDQFDPSQIETAVRQAWQALAGEIWQGDIAPHLSGENLSRAQAVWQRQVNHFWEIYWIIAPDTAPYAMDWRKNWRTPNVVEEPGVKCSQMAGLQELSGIEGMGGKDQQYRRNFWAILQERLGGDLAEGEQLSAIALIKRRLYKYFHQVQVTVVDAVTIHGLKMQREVPSAALLAAMPALQGLPHDNLQITKSLNAIHSNWKRLVTSGGEGERDCWKTSPKHDAFYLDGQVWFEKTYDNPQAYGLKNDRQLLNETKRAVQDLWREAGMTPQPYFALLSMDGDRLGQQMGEAAKRPFISEALADFTRKVPEIVQAHNGHLIYAGGDDVMALLPVKGALDCAAALRKAYMTAFDQVNSKAEEKAGKIDTTISAAVLFAPYDRPLNRMLERVFTLLDSVSKDHTGRDAITVEVLKGSGRHLLWTQPWSHALAGDHLKISQLGQQLSGEDAEFSHRFYYRLVDYIALLAPELRHQQHMASRTAVDLEQARAQKAGVAHVNETIKKMWAVAVVQSRANGVTQVSDAERLVTPLWEQSIPYQYRKDQKMPEPAGIVRPDGALLVKFLAQYARQTETGGQA